MDASPAQVGLEKREKVHPPADPKKTMVVAIATQKGSSQDDSHNQSIFGLTMRPFGARKRVLIENKGDRPFFLFLLVPPTPPSMSLTLC